MAEPKPTVKTLLEVGVVDCVVGGDDPDAISNRAVSPNHDSFEAFEHARPIDARPTPQNRPSRDLAAFGHEGPLSQLHAASSQALVEQALCEHAGLCTQPRLDRQHAHGNVRRPANLLFAAGASPCSLRLLTRARFSDPRTSDRWVLAGGTTLRRFPGAIPGPRPIPVHRTNGEGILCGGRHRCFRSSRSRSRRSSPARRCRHRKQFVPLDRLVP